MDWQSKKHQKTPLNTFIALVYDNHVIHGFLFQKSKNE